jgi:hypothetical protein
MFATTELGTKEHITSGHLGLATSVRLRLGYEPRLLLQLDCRDAVTLRPHALHHFQRLTITGHRCSLEGCCDNKQLCYTLTGDACFFVEVRICLGKITKEVCKTINLYWCIACIE